MLYFIILLGFLFLIVLIGFSVFQLVKNKITLSPFESLTLWLFSGYVITITIFSIWQTAFKTVNILFVLLLLFAWWEIHKMPLKEKRQNDKIGVTHLSFLFLALCFFFALCYYSICNPSGYLPFHYTNPDYIFYGKMAKYISITGQENGFFNLNQLDSYYNGPEAYHFFDLWGASVGSYIFGINQYLCLRLIVYPIFYLLSFLSAICIFKNLMNSKIIITFICLWFGGFYLMLFDSIPLIRPLNVLATNLFFPGSYKLSYFYAFFICAYVLFEKRLYSLSILCLLGLTIANVIAVPSICATLIIIVIILYWSKRITNKQLITNSIYILAFLCSIALFYSLLKTERAGLAQVELTSPWKLLQDSFTAANLKTQINIILGCGFFLSILYFALFFWAFQTKIWLKLTHPLTAFVIISLTISILSWAILFENLNSPQLFYATSVTLLNATCIILILNTVDNFKQYYNTYNRYYIGLLSFFVILIILSNIYYTAITLKNAKAPMHTNAYIKEIDLTIPDGALVGSLKSISEMSDMHAKNNVVYTIGNYLFLFDRDINIVTINDLETPIDSSSQRSLKQSIKAVSNGLFYRFAKSDENKNLNNDEILLKFLNKFNIRYVVATKNATPSKLIQMNTKRIIQDSLSGEKFIILNKELKPIE